MRAVPMCFSILRAPKSGIHTLANVWKQNFHTLNNHGHSSWFNRLGFRIFNLEGGHNKRWTRKSVTSKAGRKTKSNPSGKPSDIRNEILEGSVSTSCTVSINKTESSEMQKLQYCEIQPTLTTESRDLTEAVTVIAFDIETTGLSRWSERIIEIGCQDLSGGQNSTFQTFVNPGCCIPNSYVHGITSHMVDRPDVPRMKDLIPILLEFIRSRQKPGGYVILVAHNARSFDVPFLIKEFTRCSFEIPLDWRFLDTMPLCRELVKSLGSKAPPKISLKAMREHYGIPLLGSAHRAMSDVRSLSLILQRLTFDLKLSMSDIVERSFTASDLAKKKK